MIQSIISQAVIELSEHSPSPRLDAEVLLCHLLSCDRSFLFTHPEHSLSECQFDLFSQWIFRRKKGEPIAYIIGVKEFWSLSLDVTKATLIPRPETECLVEFILQLPKDKALKIADLGTGSGAIAIALASERPDWKITATDQSHEALEVAERNAVKHQVTQINFRQGSWCNGLLEHDYDLIVSNPPYLPDDDPHLDALRFEPANALKAGCHGLEWLHQIIKEARDYLRTGGYLVLEHGHDQASKVIALLEDYNYIDIRAHHDYSSNPRFVTAKR